MNERSAAGRVAASRPDQDRAAGDSLFAQLVAVSRLRDPLTDTYFSPPGRTPPTPAEDQRLRAEHDALFHRFLELSLEEMTDEVRPWLTSVSKTSSKVLDGWRRLETYRAILPNAATELETDLFVSEMKLVLPALIREELPVVHSPLTERETQVLFCLARGLTSKEVAECLKISVHTVFHHRRHIGNKLGAQSAAHLVALGARMVASVRLGRKDADR